MDAQKSITELIEIYGRLGHKAYEHDGDKNKKNFRPTGIAALDFFEAMEIVITEEDSLITDLALSLDGLESPGSVVHWTYKGNEPHTYGINWSARFRMETASLDALPTVVLELHRRVSRKGRLGATDEQLGEMAYWGQEQVVLGWVKQEIALGIVSERLFRPFSSSE